MFKTVLLFNLWKRAIDLDGDQAELKFSAAYPGNQQPELQKVAKEFFTASPSGTLEFSTINKAVVEQMSRGKYYLVTIQEFDPEKPWQEQV